MRGNREQTQPAKKCAVKNGKEHSEILLCHGEFGHYNASCHLQVRYVREFSLIPKQRETFFELVTT